AGRTVSSEGPPPAPGGVGVAGQNAGSASQGSAVTQVQTAGSGSAIADSRPPASLSSDAGNSARATATLGTQTPCVSGDPALPTSASSSSAETASPSLLRNSRTGQVFSWNGSGWQ